MDKNTQTKKIGGRKSVQPFEHWPYITLLVVESNHPIASGTLSWLVLSLATIVLGTSTRHLLRASILLQALLRSCICAYDT